MKNQHTTFPLSCVLAAILLVSPQALYSAVVVDPDSSGATDVDPANPSTWTSSTYGYVGDTSDGAVLVAGGSVVDSASTTIGSGSAATGAVTIDGSGSTWNCVESLSVGSSGSGTLTITNGGTVNVGYYSSIGGWDAGASGVVTVDGSGSTLNCDESLYVGDTGGGALAITNSAEVIVGVETIVAGYTGSLGSIDFGVGGGTLTTRGLLCSPTQLTGTGTINTLGLASDVNLVFDATNGLMQTLSFNGSGQNITVNLDVSGTSGTTGELGVGYLGNGSMAILDGVSITSISGSIGRYSGSTGTVTVDGTDSNWTCEDGIYIGEEGSGTLTITNGGTVNLGYYGIIGGWDIGSSGVVTVDGAGSTLTCMDWLSVGEVGSGMLAITNGAAVLVDETTYVAYSDGLSGSIDFGANGGTLTTGSFLGSPTQLTGTGTINARGLVSDVDLVFDSTNGLMQTLSFNGPGQNITVNLDVSGTSGVAGTLGAGYLGSGSLTIKDGVTVTSTYGDIGFHSGSTGTVTVDGPGSTWICDDGLSVGEGGSGTLTITNGAAVDVGFNVNIGGWEVGAIGVVTVDGTGSSLTSGDGIGVGGSDSGTLTISNGATVASDSYFSIGGWNLDSNGLVTVDGSGSSLECSDYFYIGDTGSGLLQITNGGLVSVGGTLSIDTYGDGNSFVDMYNGGMLALLGDAEDSLASFLGLIEGTDALRYWDSSLSAWTDIGGATLGDDYTLSYQTTGDLTGYTRLTVSAALAGDANGDGEVDVTDLGILATNYGTTSGAELADGDFNGDGKVDVTDLGVLATMYGKTIEAPPSVAVPEPSGVVLLTMGAVGLLLCARQKER